MFRKVIINLKPHLAISIKKNYIIPFKCYSDGKDKEFTNLPKEKEMELDRILKEVEERRVLVEQEKLKNLEFKNELNNKLSDIEYVNQTTENQKNHPSKKELNNNIIDSSFNLDASKLEEMKIKSKENKDIPIPENKQKEPTLFEIFNDVYKKDKATIINQIKHGQETVNQTLNNIHKRMLQNLSPLKEIEWSRIKENPRLIISSLSKTLNDVTGYAEIEKLKLKITKAAEDFEGAKQALKTAKEQHQACINARAKGQRDINELLQRKHSWNDADVTKFTQLYREEHSNESLEHHSLIELKECEDNVEKSYAELVTAIRNRYHEEQLWSDKIRSASTYWTSALILINMLLFLSVHTIFEPRKRAKLVERVSERFENTWIEEKKSLETIIEPLKIQINQQQYHNLELIRRLDLLEKQNQIQNHQLIEKETDLASSISKILNEKEKQSEINMKQVNKWNWNGYEINNNDLQLVAYSALSGAILSTIVRFLMGY